MTSSAASRAKKRAPAAAEPEVELPPHERVELPSRRRLLVATAVALAIALLVVVLFVMPAEYGKDPTGLGKLTGISKLYSVPAPPLEPVNTTGAELSTFNVTWIPRELPGGDASGDSAPGDVTKVPFTVAFTNVTRVTAILTWTDEPIGGQATGPDLFELNLTAPSGETRSFLGRNEGPNGTLAAAYVVDGFPDPTQVTAKDHVEALKETHALVPARLGGTGAWLAQVRLVEAGGLPLVNAGDPGNAWTLRIFVQTFYPALGDPQLSKARADELHITVPARGQLEFKARMVENASFTYDWSAPSDLNYEMHGDSQGTQVERFQSYERGTAKQKAGEFRAPFTGRHGWYWQNPSDAALQVTLKLRGEYVIVGIV